MKWGDYAAHCRRGKQQGFKPLTILQWIRVTNIVSHLPKS